MKSETVASLAKSRHLLNVRHHSRQALIVGSYNATTYFKNKRIKKKKKKAFFLKIADEVRRFWHPHTVNSYTTGERTEWQRQGQWGTAGK